MVSEGERAALPASAGAPAPYESRDEYALASGRAVMRLVADGIRPRDICTRKAFENAATIVLRPAARPTAACTCRPWHTNDRIRPMDVCAIFKRTPYIADLKPGGKYVAKDVSISAGAADHARASTAATCTRLPHRDRQDQAESRNVSSIQIRRLSIGFETHITNRRSSGAAGLVAPEGTIVRAAGMSSCSSVARRCVRL
jgi:dihydroxy-acid dehydratase